MKTVDEWLERYRQFWEERLDRLEDYLNTLQAETAAPKTAAGPSTGKTSRKKTHPVKESRHGRKK